MMLAAFREAVWRRPEWSAAALGALSWVGVIGEFGTGSVDAAGHVHHGHLPSDTVATPSPADLQPWILMTLAMMLPTALPAIRRLAFASLSHRRQRAIGVFVGSYVGVWLAFGAVALAAVQAARTFIDVGAAPLLPGTLVVAAGWELTRYKRRRLRACHIIAPPAPFGWKADLGCARAGVVYGWRCLGSCWALMLVMAVAGHHGLPLVLLVSAIVAAEKLLVRGGRLGVPAAASLLAAAGIVLAA